MYVIFSTHQGKHNILTNTISKGGEIMTKRRLTFIILSVFFISSCILFINGANATLLGLKQGYPDLHSDNSGLVKYTYTGTGINVLELEPDAVTLSYSTMPGSTYEVYRDIDNQKYTTIAIYVDDNGSLVSGVPDSQPIIGGERYNDIKLGAIDVNGNQTGDLDDPGYDNPLLLANVISFGWESTAAGRNTFELMFEYQGGEITELNPGWGTYPIGCIITTENVYAGHGLTGSLFSDGWTESWEASPAKVDQFPTPEPVSLVLLCSGFLGLIGIKRRF